MQRWSLRAAVLAASVLSASWLLLSSAPEALGEISQRKVDEDPRGLPYVAGELIVLYEKGEIPERPSVVNENQALEGTGGEVEEEIPELNAQVLTFHKGEDEHSEGLRGEALEEEKAELEKDPRVASVDYNYLRKTSLTPNDPRFGAQYGLKRPSFPRAWDRIWGGAGTRIAVVDSGIDFKHPDLARRVAAQKDFVGAGDGKAQDDFGHGTHVAGIAAAATGNGRGVAGACPGCRLLVAKTVGPDGTTTVADEIEGILWAANNGAKVVNLSLGGPGYVQAERDAVDYAWSKGAVVVAAAGNAATSVPDYPAGYPKAIAVTATDSRDRAASFSNRGNWVDVSAPGVDILSTTLGRGYGSMSGTSMSTPYVAGLAGLLASQDRSNTEIRKRILETADDLGPKGRDPRFGSGRIDAARAVGTSAR